ncbi:MAG: metallophosphoesterase family protein, partial [Thermodesulfobacteriota bacterium]
MRYAIISDIHGNLEAFVAALETIDTLGVDKIVCLGDIVGYNSNPEECVDLLRRKGIIPVLGNHDSRVIGLDDPRDFNALAEDALYWT